MTPDEFVTWAAGFFEGEGSIGITRPCRRNLGALWANISNTELDTLEGFQARWGGNIRQASQPKAHHRPIWRWTVRSREAARFLAEISPFLRSAKYINKTTVAVAYQAQKSSDQHTIRKEPYRTAQEAFYVRMKALNTRGTPLDKEALDGGDPENSGAYV